MKKKRTVDTTNPDEMFHAIAAIRSNAMQQQIPAIVHGAFNPGAGRKK
jgi:hypothetical protein